MHHPLVSWHIIPLEFSSWNIVCFWQKESFKEQFFRLFSALMKVHPIPHAIFETARSRFVQILHHISVSWKITPLYCFSSNLYTLDKKTYWIEILSLWVVERKSTKFLMSCLKLQVLFSWFWQKEPIKLQNLRLLTADVKFHQICTLIGCFCWKYIKFQLKKYRGVMSHNTEEWCKVARKTDLLFQKWQEFGEFWPEHSKVSLW